MQVLSMDLVPLFSLKYVPCNLKSKPCHVYLQFYLILYHMFSSRFYDLAGLQNGILKRGREIFLTGCYLRTATGGSGRARLLPTEYLVILLDEVTFKVCPNTNLW